MKVRGREDKEEKSEEEKQANLKIKDRKRTRGKEK